MFLIKKIVVFLFVIVKKIVVSVLNFLFFKIMVKLYYNYILIYKKIKEINKRNNSRLYLLKKNASIFIIISLVFIIIISNNIKKTEAQTLVSQIYKTALAQNIESDFKDLEQEELIVEIIESKKIESITSPQYINQVGLLKARNKTSKSSTEEESNSYITTDHGGALPSSGITPAEINGQRNEIIEYLVVSGDTITSIAEYFNLNVSTILWENNLTARSLIKPGNKITILPSDGIRHTVIKNENISKISKKYEISAEKIIDSNDIEPEEALKIGQKLFIPGGKKIIEATTIVSKTYSGTTITQNTNQNTKQEPAYSGGKLLWPTVGARITQYYSWSHKGLDIANKTGTPLYAAESGTVERSGWNNGYGYNVVINHGGGLKTLYAHASKIHVKTGEKVIRGDIIANMGSTGWSTGPHIHFEVILNGVKQNPLNYIK